MRTVKGISDLTGISVRTLHYYDEIGLLKPTDKSEVSDGRLLDLSDGVILAAVSFWNMGMSEDSVYFASFIGSYCIFFLCC